MVFSPTNTLTHTPTTTSRPAPVIQQTPTVTIQRFQTTATQVTIQDLVYGKALIPVSWEVSNRPSNSNLVFEQVLPEGSAANIELPRDNPWVNSSGQGVVRPGFPADGETHIILQLRVVNTSTGRTLTSQQISIPMIEGTAIPIPAEPNPTPATMQTFENCFTSPFPPVMNLTVGEEVTYNYPSFETASPVPNEIYRTAMGTNRITSLVGVEPTITVLDVVCFKRSTTDIPMRRWQVRDENGIEGWMDEYFQLSNGEYWYLLRDSYAQDVIVHQFSLSETSVNQGEMITIEWDVENADYVSIQINASILLTSDGNTLPASGSLDITAPRTHIVIFEMLHPPNLAEPLRLEVNCTHALIDTQATASMACPDAPQTIRVTVQYFESGYMMKFPSGIIVAGNNAGYFQYRLTGTDVTFPDEAPDGLFPPADPFSNFWETQLMQTEIGWAIAEATTFTTTTQTSINLEGTYETLYFFTPDDMVKYVGYNVD